MNAYKKILLLLLCTLSPMLNVHSEGEETKIEAPFLAARPAQSFKWTDAITHPVDTINNLANKSRNTPQSPLPNQPASQVPQATPSGSVHLSSLDFSTPTLIQRIQNGESISDIFEDQRMKNAVAQYSPETKANLFNTLLDARQQIKTTNPTTTSDHASSLSSISPSTPTTEQKQTPDSALHAPEQTPEQGFMKELVQNHLVNESEISHNGKIFVVKPPYSPVSKNKLEKFVDWITSKLSLGSLGHAKAMMTNKAFNSYQPEQDQALADDFRNLDSEQKADVANTWLQARAKLYDAKMQTNKLNMQKLQDSLTSSPESKEIGIQAFKDQNNELINQFKNDATAFVQEMTGYLSPNEQLLQINTTQTASNNQSIAQLFKFTISTTSQEFQSQPASQLEQPVFSSQVSEPSRSAHSSENAPTAPQLQRSSPQKRSANVDDKQPAKSAPQSSAHRNVLPSLSDTTHASKRKSLPQTNKTSTPTQLQLGEINDEQAKMLQNYQAGLQQHQADQKNQLIQQEQTQRSQLLNEEKTKFNDTIVQHSQDVSTLKTQAQQKQQRLQEQQLQQLQQKQMDFQTQHSQLLDDYGSQLDELLSTTFHPTLQQSEQEARAKISTEEAADFTQLHNQQQQEQLIGNEQAARSKIVQNSQQELQTTSKEFADQLQQLNLTKDAQPAEAQQAPKLQQPAFSSQVSEPSRSSRSSANAPTAPQLQRSSPQKRSAEVDNEQPDKSVPQSSAPHNALPTLSDTTRVNTRRQEGQKPKPTLPDNQPADITSTQLKQLLLEQNQLAPKLQQPVFSSQVSEPSRSSHSSENAPTAPQRQRSTSETRTAETLNAKTPNKSVEQVSSPRNVLRAPSDAGPASKRRGLQEQKSKPALPDNQPAALDLSQKQQAIKEASDAKQEKMLQEYQARLQQEQDAQAELEKEFKAHQAFLQQGQQVLVQQQKTQEQINKSTQNEQDTRTDTADEEDDLFTKIQQQQITDLQQRLEKNPALWQSIPTTMQQNLIADYQKNLNFDKDDWDWNVIPAPVQHLIIEAYKNQFLDKQISWLNMPLSTTIRLLLLQAIPWNNFSEQDKQNIIADYSYEISSYLKQHPESDLPASMWTSFSDELKQNIVAFYQQQLDTSPYTWASIPEIIRNNIVNNYIIELKKNPNQWEFIPDEIQSSILSSYEKAFYDKDSSWTDIPVTMQSIIFEKNPWEAMDPKIQQKIISDYQKGLQNIQQAHALWITIPEYIKWPIIIDYTTQLEKGKIQMQSIPQIIMQTDDMRMIIERHAGTKSMYQQFINEHPDQWIHIPNDMKKIILENYQAQLGQRKIIWSDIPDPIKISTISPHAYQTLTGNDVPPPLSLSIQQDIIAYYQKQWHPTPSLKIWQFLPKFLTSALCAELWKNDSARTKFLNEYYSPAVISNISSTQWDNTPDTVQQYLIHNQWKSLPNTIKAHILSNHQELFTAPKKNMFAPSTNEPKQSAPFNSIKPTIMTDYKEQLQNQTVTLQEIPPTVQSELISDYQSQLEKHTLQWNNLNENIKSALIQNYQEQLNNRSLNWNQIDEVIKADIISTYLTKLKSKKNSWRDIPTSVQSIIIANAQEYLQSNPFLWDSLLKQNQQTIITNYQQQLETNQENALTLWQKIPNSDIKQAIIQNYQSQLQNKKIVTSTIWQRIPDDLKKIIMQDYQSQLTKHPTLWEKIPTIIQQELITQYQATWQNISENLKSVISQSYQEQLESSSVNAATLWQSIPEKTKTSILEDYKKQLDANSLTWSSIPIATYADLITQYSSYWQSIPENLKAVAIKNYQMQLQDNNQHASTLWQNLPEGIRTSIITDYQTHLESTSTEWQNIPSIVQPDLITQYKTDWQNLSTKQQATVVQMYQTQLENNKNDAPTLWLSIPEEIKASIIQDYQILFTQYKKFSNPTFAWKTQIPDVVKSAIIEDYIKNLQTNPFTWDTIPLFLQSDQNIKNAHTYTTAQQKSDVNQRKAEIISEYQSSLSKNTLDWNKIEPAIKSALIEDYQQKLSLNQQNASNGITWENVPELVKPVLIADYQQKLLFDHLGTLNGIAWDQVPNQIKPAIISAYFNQLKNNPDSWSKIPQSVQQELITEYQSQLELPVLTNASATPPLQLKDLSTEIQATIIKNYQIKLNNPQQATTTWRDIPDNIKDRIIHDYINNKTTWSNIPELIQTIIVHNYQENLAKTPQTWAEIPDKVKTALINDYQEKVSINQLHATTGITWDKIPQQIQSILIADFQQQLSLNQQNASSGITWNQVPQQAKSEICTIYLNQLQNQELLWSKIPSTMKSDLITTYQAQLESQESSQIPQKDLIEWWKIPQEVKADIVQSYQELLADPNQAPTLWPNIPENIQDAIADSYILDKAPLNKIPDVIRPTIISRHQDNLKTSQTPTEQTKSWNALSSDLQSSISNNYITGSTPWNDIPITIRSTIINDYQNILLLEQSQTENLDSSYKKLTWNDIPEKIQPALINDYQQKLSLNKQNASDEITWNNVPNLVKPMIIADYQQRLLLEPQQPNAISWNKILTDARLAIISTYITQLQNGLTWSKIPQAVQPHLIFEYQSQLTAQSSTPSTIQWTKLTPDVKLAIIQDYQRQLQHHNTQNSFALWHNISEEIKASIITDYQKQLAANRIQWSNIPLPIYSDLIAQTPSYWQNIPEPLRSSAVINYQVELQNDTQNAPTLWDSIPEQIQTSIIADYQKRLETTNGTSFWKIIPDHLKDVIIQNYQLRLQDQPPLWLEIPTIIQQKMLPQYQKAWTTVPDSLKLVISKSFQQQLEIDPYAAPTLWNSISKKIQKSIIQYYQIDFQAKPDEWRNIPKPVLTELLAQYNDTNWQNTATNIKDAIIIMYQHQLEVDQKEATPLWSKIPETIKESIIKNYQAILQPKDSKSFNPPSIWQTEIPDIIKSAIIQNYKIQLTQDKQAWNKIPPFLQPDIKKNYLGSNVTWENIPDEIKSDVINAYHNKLLDQTQNWDTIQPEIKSTLITNYQQRLLLSPDQPNAIFWNEVPAQAKPVIIATYLTQLQNNQLEWSKIPVIVQSDLIIEYQSQLKPLESTNASATPTLLWEKISPEIQSAIAQSYQTQLSQKTLTWDNILPEIKPSLITGYEERLLLSSNQPNAISWNAVPEQAKPVIISTYFTQLQNKKLAWSQIPKMAQPDLITEYQSQLKPPVSANALATPPLQWENVLPEIQSAIIHNYQMKLDLAQNQTLGNTQNIITIWQNIPETLKNFIIDDYANNTTAPDFPEQLRSVRASRYQSQLKEISNPAKLWKSFPGYLQADLTFYYAKNATAWQEAPAEIKLIIISDYQQQLQEASDRIGLWGVLSKHIQSSLMSSYTENATAWEKTPSDLKSTILSEYQQQLNNPQNSTALWNSLPPYLKDNLTSSYTEKQNSLEKAQDQIKPIIISPQQKPSPKSPAISNDSISSNDLDNKQITSPDQSAASSNSLNQTPTQIPADTFLNSLDTSLKLENAPEQAESIITSSSPTQSEDAVFSYPKDLNSWKKASTQTQSKIISESKNQLQQDKNGESTWKTLPDYLKDILAKDYARKLGLGTISKKDIPSVIQEYNNQLQQNSHPSTAKEAAQKRAIPKASKVTPLKTTTTPTGTSKKL